MGDLRTSTYLRDYLALTDAEGLEPPEGEEPLSPEFTALFELWKALFVGSIEGLSLSTKECEQVHQLFSVLGDRGADELDDYFTRHLLERVPELVKRILRFEPVIVANLPTGPANVYLREAVRCYVFGLNQGAITLARAAMEQGLRERVPLARQQGWSLDELIRNAAPFKVLEPAYLQTAREVQQRGNEVLHSGPCTSDVACDVLTKTRAVLEQLFNRT